MKLSKQTVEAALARVPPGPERAWLYRLLSEGEATLLALPPRPGLTAELTDPSPAAGHSRRRRGARARAADP